MNILFFANEIGTMEVFRVNVALVIVHFRTVQMEST